MRRRSFLLILLVSSAPLHAQGVFAGLLVDSKLNTPLQCVDVVLEDSAAHEVAHAQTASDGAFQFDSPAAGSYRPRFTSWRHAPVYGTFETLDPTSERQRVYRVDFGPASPGRQKFWPDTTDSAPTPLDPGKVHPHYPFDLKARLIEGSVSVRFVVDSAGAVMQPTLRVLQSSHADFASEVLRYLRAVRFAPARRAGKPVCAIILDEDFTFSIERGR